MLSSSSGNIFSCFVDIRSNPYYRLLAALAFISAVAMILADFQFKRAIALEIAEQSAMTRVLGLFSMASSAGALTVQWLLLPALLRRFHPQNLILFLPCSFLFFSVWMIFSPVLLPALMLKGSEGGFSA